MLNIHITANDDGGIESISVQGTKAEKQTVTTNAIVQGIGPRVARFTDNNDGTITDHELGLQWSKDDASTKALKFTAAEKACNEFKLAGHNDWRLPTRKELASLVDDTKHKPAIDTDFFPSCKSEYYWTQTPVASAPEDYAWIVHFYHGHVSFNNRNLTACVRAVRSVSPPSQ